MKKMLKRMEKGMKCSKLAKITAQDSGKMLPRTGICRASSLLGNQGKKHYILTSSYCT